MIARLQLGQGPSNPLNLPHSPLCTCDILVLVCQLRRTPCPPCTWPAPPTAPWSPSLWSHRRGDAPPGSSARVFSRHWGSWRRMSMTLEWPNCSRKMKLFTEDKKFVSPSPAFPSWCHFQASHNVIVIGDVTSTSLVVFSVYMVLSYGFQYFYTPNYHLVSKTPSQTRKVGELVTLMCKGDSYWEWCR